MGFDHVLRYSPCCVDQVEKEEKEAQERAIVQKDEAPAVQEQWSGEAVQEVTDWASEPVAPAVQPFGTAPAPTPAAAAPTEDWSMPAQEDWSAQTSTTTNEWGGGASTDTWG